MNRLIQCLQATFTGALFLLIGVAAHGEGVISQTNVDQAKHMVNQQGVVQLSIEGLGLVDHPAWTALYALAYAGVEDYDPTLGLKPDRQRFTANITWLKSHLHKDQNDLWVWPYRFDSTYKDVSIKAPWSSAFAQAVGIQALLADWKLTRDKSSLALAVKAAESLFVPLDKGGFLFTRGDDIWFEEIPSSAQNSSHILNGHMRVLLALSELQKATGDARYGQWLAKGSDTLLRWLPLYDAGYWLRYDLNPRKQELLFRLANPYGFANPELAIDRIVLRDPVSGKESVLDIGSTKDAEGTVRIAGNDWGQIETLDGRTVRRLKPVAGEREAADSEGQMVAPYTYFYLTLPSEWQDNLRQQRFELVVEYLDERTGNLEVQMRSIAPGSDSFHSLPDGELLLSGSKQWRQWKVPVKPRDLGNWVGNTYGLKHAEYLARIAALDPRFETWQTLSRAYVNTRSMAESADVQPGKDKIPQQTPVLPWYSMGSDGVLLMHIKQAGSRKKDGTPVHSLFVVASQAMVGDEMKNRAGILNASEIGKQGIRKKPAIDWLLNIKNQVAVKDAVIYTFNFLNVYNDVVTPAPWQSSFGQTYVMKALYQTLKEQPSEALRIRALLEQTLKAYSIDTVEGGLAYTDRQGGLFFEEVPNRTHVLNAQLSALPVIDELTKSLDFPVGRKLWRQGLSSLAEHLSRFDTGYWMRYDLNPKKELLFQIDWLQGEASPLIESIRFEAPQFSKAVRLDIASKKAFEGHSRITGLQWSDVQQVDGRRVRSFSNGYLINPQAVEGGTRHNVYVQMQLPVAAFGDYFDVQSHRLLIRYKDVAAGRFVVKVQSINDGNALAFIPLHNAVIIAKGDQQWKTAVIEVRPQDMGWYKGPEYQIFEVDQLDKIAALTGDWFFEQYAQRQRYFLNARKNGVSVIAQPLVDSSSGAIALSIIDSSPTYEGFGFANALDADANNDYVASQENVLESHVTLRLERPTSQGVLAIKWESTLNYPGHLRVLAVNAQGDEQIELASLDLEKGDDTNVQLGAQAEFQSLRLEFSRFKGQPRLLMRLIEFKAAAQDPLTWGKLSSSKAGGGKIENYLSAIDPRNPLSIFRVPVTQKVKTLSDELVTGISDPHLQIMAFMKHIDSFKVGIASAGTPDATLEERIGACGSFTNTLLALAAAQGLEGRYVNLHNYPANNGHTVAEIRLNKKWALYDPTFGAFYTRVGAPDPLSYDEIKSGYDEGLAIEIHHDSRRDGLEAFTGRSIFTQASPAGVIGPDKPFYFPLQLSLYRQNTIEDTQFGPSLQGADYIGAAYINQQQVWTLEGLKAQGEYIFDVVAKNIGGDLTDGSRQFVLVAKITDKTGFEKKITHTFDFKNSQPQHWKIPLVATADTLKVELLHDYVGPDYRYLNMQSYSLYGADHP